MEFVFYLPSFLGMTTKLQKFRSLNSVFYLFFFRFTDLLLVCNSQNIRLVWAEHCDWPFQMHFLLCNLTGPGLFWAVKDLPRCLAGVCRSSGPEDIQVIKTKCAWLLEEFKFLWTSQDCYIYLYLENIFIKTFYNLCFVKLPSVEMRKIVS